MVEARPVPARTRARRRLVEAFVSPDSYGLVLLLIVLTYALSISQDRSPLAASAVLLVQIVTVWFALRTSEARRGLRLAATVVLIAAGFIAVAGGVTGDSSLWAVLLASSILYLLAPIVIVRHLVARPAVDRETVLGAIAAYLLIGMLFAFVYRFLGVLDPQPFFGAGGQAGPAQALFFSFTTLTTTGYGNLVPAGNAGQTLAVVEMVIGQLFLITALGKVVTAWSPGRWQPTSTSDADRE
jgi:hypothetical protein